jgi:hypothetical protein
MESWAGPRTQPLARSRPDLRRAHPRRLIGILLPPVPWRVPVTFVVVLVALAVTGALAARIGGGSKRRAGLRVVVGGALALAFTFFVGQLLGASGVV